MARRSRERRNRGESNRDPLDDLDISTPVAKRPTPSPAPLARDIRQKSVLEDRRNWAPRLTAEPQRTPSRDTLGRPARIVHKSVAAKRPMRAAGKNFKSPQPYWLRSEKTQGYFTNPRQAIICAKRKIRKEILFALSRTGKGSRSPKRRNEWSDIGC